MALDVKAWTDPKLRGLKPKEARYEESVERGGLYVVVEPTGTKWWRYRYKINGRTERIKLGDYPTMGLADARRKFEELRGTTGTARRGESPTAKQKEQADVAERLAVPTLKELAGAWISRQDTTDKTKAERKRTLDRDVLPKLGGLRVRHLERSHCIAVIDEAVTRDAKGQARFIYKTLKSLLVYAVEKGLIEYSPMQAMKAPTRYIPKDRRLSDAEVTAFFTVLKESEMSPQARACLEWQLLTACRPSEAREATWGEVDVQAPTGPTWTIPAGRSKNGKAHVVHLSPEALAVLDVMRPFKQPGREAPLFPGRVMRVVDGEAGQMRASPLSVVALARAVSRLQKNFTAELRKATKNENATFEPFTPHDLRRTAASLVTSLGFNRFIAGLLLNHTDTSVTSIYDRHDYEEEKRSAWLALGARVAVLKAGTEGKVVPIRDAA